MFMKCHRNENGAISHPLNFLKGYEIEIIDGELKIHGTGTEDYFNAIFYFLEGGKTSQIIQRFIHTIWFFVKVIALFVVCSCPTTHA